MTKSKLTLRVCLWSCALALVLLHPAKSRAQVPVADTSQPLIVKKGNAKPIKFYGEVVSSNAQSIRVRGQQNKTVVREFSYGPRASAQMSRAIAKGGYRFGDKVVIDYAAGSDVALSIKGKPSKAG